MLVYKWETRLLIISLVTFYQILGCVESFFLFWKLMIKQSNDSLSVANSNTRTSYWCYQIALH